jgi:hypothetical protein
METDTTNNRVVVGIFSTMSTRQLIRVMLVDLVYMIGLLVAGLIIAAMYSPHARTRLRAIINTVRHTSKAPPV